MKKVLGLCAAVALMGAATSAQAARDYVWAAGSSTVFPFTTRVAENFSRKTGMKAPKVESLGTGGGIKLFCSGVGDNFPDIANASRRMTAAEFDTCRANGVTDIVEMKVGFDGIVIAADRNAPDYQFRLPHLYLALGANVLRGGKFVPNPYTNWNEIGPGLPDNRILVYGPPPTSGTRDAFVELGIEASARTFPTAAALRERDEDEFKQMTHPLRREGWVDSGENDNAIVQTLTKTPGSLGVFGYSFLEENGDKVKAMSIDGVAPTVANIAQGTYPLSRSMYIYVKKAHVGVTQGLQEFVTEFASDAATGRGGYLQGRGLIPLPADQHEAMKAVASGMTTMSRP
ncbi:MAG: substrate-binding domain-containing protein [Caulobacteraceae bacterium]|jgi:phosphate transport system substrate-binding protein|nr:substrate-binding domain-containing protein [Caulobacteraceae bacterium]MDX5394550.1 substrate-binding domain-containing protein [Caulobacteraceae bacterium]